MSEDDSWGSQAVQVVVADDARQSFMVQTYDDDGSGILREGSQRARSSEAPVDDRSSSSAPVRREQDGTISFSNASAPVRREQDGTISYPPLTL